MNRNSTALGSRESLRNLFPNGATNGGSYPVDSRHRSSQALPSKDRLRTTDENLDLFSRNRRISSYETDTSSDASARVNASVKLGKNYPLDDLLFSTDCGKHDYDWLLTPPGTPLFPSKETNDSNPAASIPPKTSLTRSSSVSKISRLSLSQPEIINPPLKPSRSNSVARSSISSTSNRSSATLNTSSGLRSSSTMRPSTPTPRTPVARTSALPKPRPNLSAGPERPRLSQNSKPSTPTSRTHVPASHNLLPSRSIVRPATPTRRNSVCTQPTPISTRVSSSDRPSVISSRPSSPNFRQRPVIPPEYPLSTPPNLRTTLPDRPLSAGRSRPAKAPPDVASPSPRRLSSPITTRGSLSSPSRVSVGVGVRPQNELPEMQRRLSISSEPGGRRLVKSTPVSGDVGAFARTTARKSIDMGSRYVGTRATCSMSPFPQSVRGSGTRGSGMNRSMASESGGYEMGRNNGGQVSGKVSKCEIFESSRYDTMLLKEDSRNTRWLHSVDDRSDLDSLFDSLPEPFA